MLQKEIKKQIIPTLVNLNELLNSQKRYFVPIYQRPYDWDEWNIAKLIETLSKLNEEKRYVFLGNMEFREEENMQQIIDGQQRITTLLMLLNYLNSEAYSDNIIKEMLKIKAQGENGNGTIIDDQYKFEEFIRNKEFSSKELAELEGYSNARLRKEKTRNFKNSNVYRLNYHYIKTSLKNINIITKEQKQKFATNILNNTYVVTINLKQDIQESEAIDIFDAINTTGKPLSIKDIFKIKMYEYSKNRGKNNPDKVIQSINKLYNKIEEKNSQIVNNESLIREEESTGKSEYNEINMISETFSQDDILKVYKFILISRVVNNKNKEERANYKSELFNMSNDNFYNKLFLQILDKNSKKQFEGFEKQEIDVQELQDIHEAYANLADIVLNLENIDAETYFAYKMLKGYTRYSWAYRFLPVLFLWRFKKIDTNFNCFVINISKIFEYYTITKKQVINYVKTFINDIIIQIVNPDSSPKEINKQIKDELKKCSRKILHNELQGEVSNTWWKKNISCLILAKNAEKKCENENNQKLLKRYQRLFTRKFDIEHICATGNDDKRFRGNKNAIGNLMLLEYSINRNIKNDDIEKKILKYTQSKFEIVKNEVLLLNMGLENYYKNYEMRQIDKIAEIEAYFD
ncbi:MAG: DUF262 domain-containing protein [Clostridia bacterium]|nr:DUF262 domain-containing protein [Clostridia bacterium]